MTRIFTDGACSGNPGAGGWAAIVLSDDHVKKISGGCEHTTNNRMELLAVIKGLTFAKTKCLREVEIASDSAYVVNAMNMGWLSNWKRSGWERKSGEPIKNIDLWMQLEDLTSHFTTLKFTKVKGHSGHHLNEMVDEMAREEVKKQMKDTTK